MNSKSLVPLSLFLVFVGPTAQAKDDNPPLPSIQWLNSMTDASAQSMSTGKPILIYLTAGYCVYCKQMDREAFVDTRAVLLSQLYVPCRMDGEHEGKSLIKKYGVKMYPYEAVVDSAGNLLSPAPEYMDPDKYVKTLATDLPEANLTSLKSQTDSTSLAQLCIVDAARGDLEGAEAAREALLAKDAPAADVTAVDHAVGLAYVEAKDFDKATAPLSMAATQLGDCHEAVGVHRLLADCYDALSRPVDEAAELNAIRALHASGKDEKKDAEKRLKKLASSK